MKLLITGAWAATQQQLEAVRSMGHDIVLHQWEKDPLPVPYEQVEGVICNGLFLHHELQNFTALRYIQLTSAGTDRVPVEQIRQRGIKLVAARDVYSTPMAEYALWGVLHLLKKGRFFEENRREKQWDKCRNLEELPGKTVCIVGCGSVGRACAKRFRAFDCRIVGVNRTVREDVFFDGIYPMERLEQGLSEADVVVLSLPLTKDTRHLLREKQLEQMKPGSILVNIARGGIVDSRALISALKTRLGGAVLDVFEEEPLSPESPFWELDNVILTPHNAFVGEGNGERLAKVILNNLSLYI